MMAQVYEIANIKRFNGNIAPDFKRMGRLVTIDTLQEGVSAVLPYVNEGDNSLVTASVDIITKDDNEDKIVFATKHSEYTLKKVVRLNDNILTDIQTVKNAMHAIYKLQSSLGIDLSDEEGYGQIYFELEEALKEAGK